MKSENRLRNKIGEINTALERAPNDTILRAIQRTLYWMLSDDDGYCDLTQDVRKLRR